MSKAAWNKKDDEKCICKPSLLIMMDSDIFSSHNNYSGTKEKNAKA